jgi:hypothetical protein
MLTDQVHEFLREFRSGTHAVLFYFSQADKQELLFSHLKSGSKNEGLVYVCSEEQPHSIRMAMKNFGIEADYLRGIDRLTICNYDEVYIVRGEVNIARIMGQFSSLARKYADSGHGGIRGAAEMSCFLRHGKINELLEYEQALHRTFSFPGEGICAYNVEELIALGYMGVIMPLIRAHDPVFFSGPSGITLVKPEDARPESLLRAIKPVQ